MKRSNIVLSRIEKNKPARDKAIELIDSVWRQRVDYPKRVDYPTAQSIACILVDNVIDALIDAGVKGCNLYYWSDVKHNIAKL